MARTNKKMTAPGWMVETTDGGKRMSYSLWNDWNVARKVAYKMAGLKCPRLGIDVGVERDYEITLEQGGEPGSRTITLHRAPPDAGPGEMPIPVPIAPARLGLNYLAMKVETDRLIESKRARAGLQTECQHIKAAIQRELDDGMTGIIARVLYEALEYRQQRIEFLDGVISKSDTTVNALRARVDRGEA